MKVILATRGRVRVRKRFSMPLDAKSRTIFETGFDEFTTEIVWHVCVGERGTVRPVLPPRAPLVS